jgi:hypothetical protein
MQCRYVQAVTTEQLNTPDRQNRQWQAFQSPRYSHANVEHIFFACGPSRREAERRAVDAILEQLVSLLNGHKHLVHVFVVGVLSCLPACNVGLC